MSEGSIEWREHGACRGLPVELFFPPVEHDAHEAKVICGMCTVRQQCLEQAVAAGEKFGIWGGLNTQERRSLAARRRKESLAREMQPDPVTGGLIPSTQHHSPVRPAMQAFLR